MNENLANENLSLDYPIADQKLITAKQFTILNIATGGVYALWWVYKEWRFIEEKDNLHLQPAGRTIFSVFFIYSLFTRILDYAKSFGYNKSYNPV
ncbi:hypothetical protein [Sphingobacterium anhuiense]|uniref:DUF4234 domain-containing protein n=1 Tax=Sphingobacterium anhuiense TaxID=493780 RepID=A0ABW5YQF8_9SPHI